MELKALAGNARTKEILSHRAQGRGLSHAYILSGPVGSGRHTLALLLAQAMVCTAEEALRPCGHCNPCKKTAEGIHPDVITISGPGEGKPITVDQIRSLRSDAHIRPNEGDRKVYLLENADQMNASAQNAMLKLLEEGPAYAAFLLLCENAGGMLETVRSRCEVLELAPVSPKECLAFLQQKYPKLDQNRLCQAAADCQGILGRAVDELEGGGEAREERLKTAKLLADALEKGSELDLFEKTMLLEKCGKNELIPLLETVEVELTGRMRAPGSRKRLFCAVELVKKLKAGAAVNGNPGQLAGLLCAGMFVNSGTGKG